MVVQLAKIAGLKVIASTGSDEKVNYLLKEIGVDVAFNYKTTSVDSALAKEGPIDLYWDNVGGQTLEAAVEHCKVNAKIIVCGYISEYNNEQQYGIKPETIYVLITLAAIKNFHWIFKKRLQIHGLLTPDHFTKWLNKFMEEVPPLVVQGKIKTKEDLVYGLDNAAQAFVDLLQGKNLGKTVVVVSEDD
ncbi:hypothetical protein Clacol_005057 [Clathrus columnatus]|uniref:Alcohol dehydrogenase-like C-terminal domain-containing protein n=1 Tax=Clathrus columnatus TaxID=1419009 RepID=A0AAV5A884_9AGAM|nr:hypothetical protein Clacol_005057 [Clathrus columnatus]